MLLRLSLAACALLLLAGCERTNKSEFAIYDWEAQRSTAGEHGVTDLNCARNACPHPYTKHVYVLGAPKLTSEDIDRGTVRAERDPQTGAWVVVLQFTPSGEKRFHELTRALAHRGRELDTPQHVLLVVDATVRSAPYIDYVHDPEGFPGETGIQFGAGSPEAARQLAKALRRD